MIQRISKILCLTAWMASLAAPTTLCAAATDEQPALAIGVAVAEITPEEGTVHDPLLAKAIVFRQGGCQAALAMCDQAIVHAELSGAVRHGAAKKAGIPAENIALTATHTHTGLKHRKDAAERIISAILQAQKAAVPVRLQTGTARVKQTISFNRRFLMTDGTIRFNPGVLNPDIVRPVGPIDPDAGILLVRNAADDKPLASLVNFALHLDTVGKYTEYAADYPYYLEQPLRKEFGESFVSLFGTGCCGDVNHVDVTRPNLKWKHTQGQTMLKPFQPKPTHASPSPVTTEHIGRTLAATVTGELGRLKTARPALAVRSEIVRAPLATFSEMDLAWAKEAVKQPRSFLMGVRANRILALERLRAKHGDSIPCEVQVFRIAEDTVIVTLPGEVFVELGLAIKKASPFANTLVLELANDRQIAYVPARKAFCEGDYEVVNSRLECGGGEMMVESAVRLLRSLIPLPPLAPLFDYPLRDPSICIGPDGMYYLTGTTGFPTWWKTNEGIRVWKSPDLKKWEPLGLVWKIDDGTWQKKMHGELRALWAPEIHYLKGTFWLTYSMNFGGCGLLKSTSGKAEGPYVDVHPSAPLTGNIDASLFEDSDGKVYFVWQNGMIARLKDDLTDLAERPRHLKPSNHTQVGFEGAFLKKIDGRYHLVCAEFNNDSYDCMIATSDKLDGPYGPRYLAIPHGGHNMLFQDKSGQWWSTIFGHDPRAPIRERPAILRIEWDAEGRVRPKCGPADKP